MFLKYSCILALIACVRATRVCDKDNSYLYDFSGQDCRNSLDSVDLPTLVEQYNYRIKSYKVITKDNYILTIFNILPKDNPKGVVFLQHPCSASCALWVDKGNASLGYVLHHAGYDVWMGNFRGNFYSREHVTLNPNEHKYWDYSYHELGIYDIPAQLDFVKRITKINKIIYIGHSMGSTAAAIYASLQPAHAVATVHKFILMGPAIYLEHLKAPIKYLAPFYQLLGGLAEIFGFEELAPHSKLTIRLLNFCRTYPGVIICSEILSRFMMGVNETNVNPAYTPIIFTQNPAGLSYKCMMHFAQNVNAHGRFAQFDYGDKNEEYYQAAISPEYPIDKIQSKISLLAGTNDDLCSVIDIQKFHNQLPEAARGNFHVLQGYTHTDFVYSSTLEEVLNPIVLDEVNAVYR